MTPLQHKISQSADRLNYSIRKIRYLIDAGELEVTRDGRAVRVIVASEDAYLEKLRQRELEQRAAKAGSGPSGSGAKTVKPVRVAELVQKKPVATLPSPPPAAAKPGQNVRTTP